MGQEAYNKFATAVKEEMPLLNYQQQLEILTIVVSAMNIRKKTEAGMSKDEKMKIFNEFSGCIKGVKQIDARKEYLDYLDERYGL